MAHPEGKFIATPKYYVSGMSSKGTEYIAVTFETESGQIDWYGYLTEGTWKRTSESLRACGWTGTDFGDFTKGGAAGFGTKKVSIVVEPEEYNGKTTNKVKWVNRINEVKEGFGSKFTAKLQEDPPPQVDVESVLNNDDPIPF